MDYVLLDTCILVNCTLVNIVGADPEVLGVIADKTREKNARLLLPEVIRHEYVRKVPEELELIREQTKRFRKAVTTQVLPSSDVDALHKKLDELDKQREESAESAKAYFTKVADDSGLTVGIPLSGDTVAEALAYSLSGRKPSSPSDKGLLDPDSLIVASVASFARANNLSGDDAILICSDNHRDFAVWDADQEKHVLAPDIALAIPCPVRYYRSPRDLVGEELEVDVESHEQLAEALAEYDEVAEAMASMSVLNKFAEAVRNLNLHQDAFKNLSANLYQQDAFKNLSANLYQQDAFKNLAGILRAYRDLQSHGDALTNLGLETPDKPDDDEKGCDVEDGEEEPGE